MALRSGHQSAFAACSSLEVIPRWVISRQGGALKRHVFKAFPSLESTGSNSPFKASISSHCAVSLQGRILLVSLISGHRGQRRSSRGQRTSLALTGPKLITGAGNRPRDGFGRYPALRVPSDCGFPGLACQMASSLRQQSPFDESYAAPKHKLE